MHLRPLIIVICCAIAIVATAYLSGKLRKDTNPTECAKQQINIDSHRLPPLTPQK